MIELVRLFGSQISAHIPELAKLRLRIFNEFPYLYVGTEEYEHRYLSVYAASQDSMAVLALDGNQVVGALTTIPFFDEHEDMKASFMHQAVDISRIFYCGEILLLKDYRGQGLGKRMFKEVEKRARSLNRFDMITLATVCRDENHPRRPPDYRSLDTFWQCHGYERQPRFDSAFTWKDLDEATESPKPMNFWVKML
jgi:GNAT superfamily N-acetyltransferase